MDPVQTNVDFQNSVQPERAIRNRNLYGGSGVAVGDFDLDGLPDLYFCSLEGSNSLFHNLGEWKFEDVTEKYGLGLEEQDSTSSVFVDLNHDGRLDLLVGGLGAGVRYFENLYPKGFVEKTEVIGLTSSEGSVSLALNDYDLDGDLDLYVVNYRPDTIRDQLNPKFEFQMRDGIPVLVSVNGRSASLPEYQDRFELSPEGQVIEYGEADALYQNQGDGKMKRISWTDGTFLNEYGEPLQNAPMDWGLSAQFRDLNGDQAPDLIVCNDLFTPDRIWLQTKDRKFKAISAFAWRHTSTFSMGVDLADIDRDGDWDFFMTDMASPDPVLRQIQVGEMRPRWWPIGQFEDTPQIPFNTLQINRGDGTFMEAAHYAGVQASDWSWGPVFLDVDLDGLEDLIIPNGQIWDTQNADLAARIEAAKKSRRFTHRALLRLVSAFPSLETPNLAFRNLGGWRFESKETEWGLNGAGITHGFAMGDLDLDGDQDLIQNNLNAPATLLRNDATAERILFRFIGWQSSGFAPQGIGARVTLRSGDFVQSREIISGGRYLSGDDPSITFAAPESHSQNHQLEVSWGGRLSWKLDGIKADRIYELDLKKIQQEIVQKSTWNSGPGKQSTDTLFSKTDQFQHQHIEKIFDDFKMQPLIPRRMSQQGPPVGVTLDSDSGEEFLLIGEGNEKDFTALSIRRGGNAVPDPAKSIVPGTDTVAVAPLGAGFVILKSGYEKRSGLKDPLKFVGAEPGAESANQLMSGWDPDDNYETLAVTDVDGDGDLDLFIGAGTKTGSYPQSGPSWLWLRQTDGNWKPGQSFSASGPVSSAVFSDWTGDGWPDLVLAVELGRIEFFENDRTGQMVKRTDEVIDNSGTGMWLSLAVGDWNRDGWMDIAAGNWGLNSSRSATRDRPLMVYHGDVDGNGVVDIFEMRWEPQLGFESALRPLQTLRMATPVLFARVRSFTQYANMDLAQLGGVRWNQLQKIKVNQTAHGIFWNWNGSNFEWDPLPKETQLTPAPSMVSGDLDGDGWDDLVIGQNWFAVNPDDMRQDAGRGLWLRNAGNENWITVSASESGIDVYGEQRGLALLDWNHDQRLDLLMTQNGADSVFLENRKGTPGALLKIEGPEKNPRGYGARVLLKDQRDQIIGSREISATFGGRSAISADILIHPQSLDHLRKVEVHWPGGKVTEKFYDPARGLDMGLNWSEAKKDSGSSR